HGPREGDVRVRPLGVLDRALGAPGDRVADLDVTLGPHPTDVPVAGQAVPRLAPVPEPPGDGAAEDLAPPGLEPLPAQPQPGDEPDPRRRARAEEPAGDGRLLDVDGPPLGGRCCVGHDLTSRVRPDLPPRALPAVRPGQTPAARAAGHSGSGTSPPRS